LRILAGRVRRVGGVCVFGFFVLVGFLDFLLLWSGILMLCLWSGRQWNSKVGELSGGLVCARYVHIRIGVAGEVL
jgi:hypothetical protein